MGCDVSRHPHPASAQQRSRRGRWPAPPSRTWSDQCSRRTHSSRRQCLSTCCRHQCTEVLRRHRRSSLRGCRRAHYPSTRRRKHPARGSRRRRARRRRECSSACCSPRRMRIALAERAWNRCHRLCRPAAGDPQEHAVARRTPVAFLAPTARAGRIVAAQRAGGVNQAEGGGRLREVEGRLVLGMAAAAQREPGGHEHLSSAGRLQEWRPVGPQMAPVEGKWDGSEGR